MVLLLSQEEEYKALSNLGQQITWFKNFICEIHVNYTLHQITVGLENQGVIDLARSKISQNGFGTKHIDVKFCQKIGHLQPHKTQIHSHK